MLEVRFLFIYKHRISYDLKYRVYMHVYCQWSRFNFFFYNGYDFEIIFNTWGFFKLRMVILF